MAKGFSLKNEDSKIGEILEYQKGMKSYRKKGYAYIPNKFPFSLDQGKIMFSMCVEHIFLIKYIVKQYVKDIKICKICTFCPIK